MTTPADVDPTRPTRPTRRRRRTLLTVLAVAVLAAGAGGTAGWASHQYPDVPAGSTFHGDIAWITRSGIARGYADGSFRPTEPVTRQTMAAFLHRSFAAISTHTQTFSTTGGTVHVVVVDCPSGKRPIAGGGRITAAPTGSAPVQISSGLSTAGSTGWAVSWRTAQPAAVTGQGQVTCIPA